MLTDKIYQLIIGGLALLVIALGVSYWLTSSELKERNLELQVSEAEAKVLEISNSALTSSVIKQSASIRDLEAKQRAKNLEVAKDITRIDTKYITKYKLVKDLNETEECIALKRIIDEEVNSSASTSSI